MNPEKRSDDSHASEKQETAPAAPMRPFSHNFFDKEIASLRMGFLKPMVMTTIIMMVVIWALLSIYWGSLWKENENSPRLTGAIVNRDAGVIGAAIRDAFLDTNNGPLPHLTWHEVSTAQYPTHAEVTEAIEPRQDYWAFVDIMPNATDALAAARAAGDESWDPSKVVTLTVSFARNMQAVPSVVVTPAQQNIMRAAEKVSRDVTAQFLQSTLNNADALTTALRAPQTMTNPVGMSLEDLRPWDQSVAIAPTFVGLIYMVILTLNLTMAGFGCRQQIAKYLTLRSFIIMRIVAPMLGYIPISLMFSLLNIPFKLTFGRAFPYGGGFMAWWCVTYTGMLIAGLCLESVITLVGPPFIGIFLIFYIIANVSVSNFPIELSPSFYKYGYAMPFYNLRQIYITIVFNSGKHVLILKYIGILWAWLALIFLTFPLFIWYEHRKHKNVGRVGAGPPA
ncbi:hypothetical protein MSPP1_003766 [Malassezia sp. CBS 17886]|nr:hypothetical protein MSPP1_003766 [Malassezia sp. CBS 17886]